MAASEAEIAELRRKVAEPTAATYSDEVLAGYIERFPLMDTDGYEPDEDSWTATYDVNRAAAEIWQEKAAGFATLTIDFSADGGSYQASQRHGQAMGMVRFFLARASPLTVKLSAVPELPEDDSDLSN